MKLVESRDAGAHDGRIEVQWGLRVVGCRFNRSSPAIVLTSRLLSILGALLRKPVLRAWANSTTRRRQGSWTGLARRVVQNCRVAASAAQPVTEVRYSAGVVSSMRRKKRVMWL